MGGALAPSKQPGPHEMRRPTPFSRRKDVFDSR
jgi:hypothetical protein